jgi:hypothetical protein
MRQEICTNRRRGVVLSDDSDYSGTILADTQNGDSMAGGSPMAFFSLQSQQPAARSFGARPTGRGLLGPRMAAAPIPVFMGRAPGSTAVAVGPGRLSPGAGRPEVANASAVLPASAAALAATSARSDIPGVDRPSSQAAIRGGNRPKPLGDEAATGTPLQLPGVVSGGSTRPGSTRPDATRPGAAAAIRPRTAAVAPAQSVTRPVQTTESKRRQDAAKKRVAAAKKLQEPRSATPKVNAPKVEAPRLRE